MDPLTNAILGLLFLGIGVSASVLMYYVRGRPVRSGAARSVTDADEYLGPWRRTSDDLEVDMAHIHQVSATGTSTIEPPFRARAA